MQPLPPQDINRLLQAAGISQENSQGFVKALEQLTLPLSPDSGRLEIDAGKAQQINQQGWQILQSLPLRSKRSETESAAGAALMEAMNDLCWRFSRVHRSALYDVLTKNKSQAVRVEDLVWRAAEQWPGLLSTKAELADEAKRMQKDKDGREIAQGLFISQMLAGVETGSHLIQSMLQPTPEAETLLEEFVAKGSLDLGPARIEVQGETGYLYLNHPRFLNAEDWETLRPDEIAVDLLLLHPGIRMGVLRGEPVDHTKYKGKRVFSAGINLTRLYHGQIPYLFYIVRDLGLVNKLYRGLAGPEFYPDDPETTREIPWIAVVDTFAIGGGCQLLLAVDYVIAESGSYFNLPARKEGIIPGAANLRLPRFMGERLARQAIMFDKTFFVDSLEARALVNEVHPREEMDAAVTEAVLNATGSGLVSAGGNRKSLRVQTEPLDIFRQYMSTYSREQAFCHLSEQLIHNLEKHWQAKDRKL